MEMKVAGHTIRLGKPPFCLAPSLKMSKRKATEDDWIPPSAAASRKGLLPSLDLSNSKTTPRVVAAALLALLPNGATTKDVVAKKIAKAFPLVMAELEKRTREMTRANESEGTRLPLAFGFASGVDASVNNDDDDDSGGEMIVVHVPEECFVRVMTFLNGHDRVKVSPVCKAWLSVSRMPALWEYFDDSLFMNMNKAKNTNMTTLLAALGRPQFVNLKSIKLPHKCQIGKRTMKSLATACPHLELLDMGYGHLGKGNAKNSELIAVAEHLPSLVSVYTNMWYVTSYGIASMAAAMKSQLLDLRISNDCICQNYLSDVALGVIAKNCPNLQQFHYSINYISCYRAFFDTLTRAGIISLIRGCRRLDVLFLRNAKQLVREDFVAILNVLGQGDAAAMNGDGTFALCKIELVGYPFVITDKPFSIVDTAIPAGNTRRLSNYGVDDGDGVEAHARFENMMMGVETMD